MTELIKRPVSQNIDVQFWQLREPGMWKARIHLSHGEKIVIGPGDILSIVRNVGNFVRLEGTWADMKVHGEDGDDE